MRGRRYYERQIDKLLTVIQDQNDRIMHLAGNTWHAPPTSPPAKPAEPRLTVRNPEQFPDDYDWNAGHDDDWSSE